MNNTITIDSRSGEPQGCAIDTQTAPIERVDEACCLIAQKIINRDTADCRETRSLQSRSIVAEPSPRLDDWKDELLAKFDELGNINQEEIALVIAAKGVDSVYVVPEFNDLISPINTLVGESRKGSEHRFQFVRKKNGGHSFFGEVIIDKTKEQPLVKLFVCDPSFIIKSNLLDAVKGIQNASVELYIPNPTISLQKGIGCSYFSLNGAFHLRNQEEYEDIYTQLPGVPKTISDDEQFNEVSLPLRLLRDSQMEEHIELINKSQVVVNKRGQTASESLKPFIKNAKNMKGEDKILNLRIEHKMKTYKEKLKKFIETNNIQSPDELNPIIQKHSIQGLQAYCDQQTSFESS